MNAVSGRQPGEALDRGNSGRIAALLRPDGAGRIVLADINDWKLPQGGKIKRFQNQPLFKRAVAEEPDRDVRFALHFDAVGRSGRQSRAAANDSRGREEAARRVAEMQSTATAAVKSARTPKDLVQRPASIA